MFASQRIIVFDTEWTSWQGFMESSWKQPGRYREIVQIGAVALDETLREIDCFEVLVRPQKNPQLSDYFVELTGISQERVDAVGVGFPEALAAFLDFSEPGPLQFGCFGRDETVIELNCGFCGIPMPVHFTDCVDIRQTLLNRGIIDSKCYSSDLPRHLGLPSIGQAHDALADSRALAAALRHLSSMT